MFLFQMLGETSIFTLPGKVSLWQKCQNDICQNDDVAVYWQSSNAKACAKKLSQILANNIYNGGRGLVSEFMWGIVGLDSLLTLYYHVFKIRLRDAESSSEKSLSL